MTLDFKVLIVYSGKGNPPLNLSLSLYIKTEYLYIPKKISWNIGLFIDGLQKRLYNIESVGKYKAAVERILDFSL